MADVEVVETRSVLRRIPLWTLLRGVVFAAIVVGVLLAMHAYLAGRIFTGLGLAGTPLDVAWAVVWGLFGLLFAGFFGRKLPRVVAVPLHWVAYSWMGLFVLLFCSVAAVDLASVGVALVRGAPVAGRWTWGASVAALALGVGAFTWGAWRALGPAVVEHIRVPIAGLPPEFEGYRVVQLSDLHVGDTRGRGFSERLAKQVNALDPDLVAVTGDLADGSPARVGEEVAPLGAMRARDGVLFVTGNHEYFNGLGGWLAEVRRHGWQVLLNEHRVLERGTARLVIGGVTDHDGGAYVSGHASSPAAAFEGAPGAEAAPRLLLAHQPRTAFQAAGLGVALQLSGHTHGGQFFPWKYLVLLQQPVLAGLARIGEVLVYTHRGTGFWGPPVRLGAPPEIAEITLTRG